MPSSQPLKERHMIFGGYTEVLGVTSKGRSEGKRSLVWMDGFAVLLDYPSEQHFAAYMCSRRRDVKSP